MLAILVFTALLAGLVYGIALSVLLDSYRQIEQDGMKRNLTRLDAAIASYSQTLHVRLLDWSQWDDTHQFVQDRNEEYISANLDDSTLVNLEVNLMAYYNANGELVYAKYVDLTSEASLPPESILSGLYAYATPVPDHAQKLSGVLRLGEDLLLTQALPILPTSGEGMPSGTLIFARFFDEALRDDISGLTQLDLNVYLPNRSNVPNDVEAYMQMRQRPAYASWPLTDKEVAGYLTITQPDGKMVAAARIVSPREVFLQGKETLTNFTLLTTGAVLIFGVIVLILLEVLLLRRFARLTLDVERIATEDLTSARVRVDSQDEIGILADKINHLLKALAEAQERSSEAAIRAQQANQQLEKNLKETEEMNRLMIGRELKMIELKNELLDLKEESKEDDPGAPNR